ncbi:MAG: histidine phosphatase family protein [Hahellaceae bacterium]|nr:histidine phosphatase family protein [Hahellaceae bacterium]
MLNRSQDDQSAGSLTIDLLRHGAVEGPPALYGQTDVPLSALGFNQMRSLPGCEAYGRIVSSPRQRCLIFARELADRVSIPLSVEPGLAEMNFGRWDGVPFSPDAPFWQEVQRFWMSPEKHTPPGGESLNEFQRRVISAFQQRSAGEQGYQLWVAHAGVIRALLAHILKAEFAQSAWHQSLHIGYASLTRLSIQAEHVSVRFIGLPAEKTA